MAWSTSNRKQTLGPNWRSTRARILKRDNHQCVWVREDTNRPCGAPANQVDHIDGHADDDSNLRALCAWHHTLRSSQQGGRAAGQAARARKNAARKRHPGIID